MNEIIFVVEEAPEGGYIAKALGASIMTQAESTDELHTHVRDAVRCHFDEDQGPAPAPAILIIAPLPSFRHGCRNPVPRTVTCRLRKCLKKA